MPDHEGGTAPVAFRSMNHAERVGARPFAVVAWVVLAVNVLVILGGSVVRATGSGDGCGSSWPKCADQILPRNAGLETAIEFTHRAMSGVAILGVVALVFLAVKWFPRAHVVRRAAFASLALLFIEALIGAALVRYGWVDQDASLGRTIVVPLHLLNTFVLLAALTVTAWWGSGWPGPRRPSGTTTGRIVGGVVALLLIAASGALSALADTLFPADTLIAGIRDEFGATAPFLLRLRVIHPVVAVSAALVLGLLVAAMIGEASGRTRRIGFAIVGLLVLQMLIGTANVVMLTPLEIQVLHLATADAIWITYVVFAASLVGAREASSAGAVAP